MAKRPNYGRAIIGCTVSILVVTSFVLREFETETDFFILLILKIKKLFYRR